MNDFKIIGMDRAQKLLMVRSVLPKEEFRHGGSMHGYQYEFGINYHTFKYSKHSLKNMTDMTDDEYDNWDTKFNKPCEK